MIMSNPPPTYHQGEGEKKLATLNATLKIHAKKSYIHRREALGMTNNTVNLHTVQYKDLGTWLDNIPL